MNTGSGCTSQRIVTGLYGVPQPVSVTGSLAPDISVLVLPTPSLPGIGGPTTLSMTVNRLSPRALPIRVEAIISPAGQLDPSRVSFGYDTCDSNAPSQFHATITSQPTKLTLNADDTGAAGALSILGGTYTLSGNNETNPTHITAHFAPVPANMSAVVDVLGNSKYTAHVTTAAPSTLGFDYVQQDSSSSTNAHIALADLPKSADVTFSPTAVSYTTSAVIHDTTVDVTTAAAKAWTTHVTAHVVDLPTSASLTQDGPKHAIFNTPSKVGDATVRFASYDPNTNPILPAPPIDANQFVHFTSRPNFLVADVRVLGFSNAVASWGDPISVDFTHLAGPFDFFVDSGSLVASGSVLNLPDHVQLSYAPATQAVAYTGSAIIGTLTADVLKTDSPLAGRADHGHLVAKGIPTGLNTVLNSDAKTFSATLTGGTLTSIELQLTNGLDQRLPDGTDGLLFNDPSDPAATLPPGTPYVIFVRATKLASATVGWGDPLSGTLTHTPAPFTVSVQTHDMTINGTLTNLPATVNFSLHVPAPSLVRQIGAPPPPPPPPTSLTYSASGPMDQLVLDIVRSTAFVKTANHVHVNAQGIPTIVGLTIDADNTKLTGDIAAPGITQLEVQLTDTADLCAPGDCLAAGPEGVRLLDEGTAIDPPSSHHYNAFVRLKGLASPPSPPVATDGNPSPPPLLFNWGDSSKNVPIAVNLHHTPGPLTLSVVSQSLTGLVPNTQHIDGKVQDLPDTVNLTYLSTNQHLTYTGSAPIGLVDAIVTNSTDYIAGQAKELDLHLENLPTSVTLDVNMSNVSNKTFSVNATGGAIGKLELFLTDGGHDDRLDFGSGDGIFIKDSSPVYNIFVRATGLQHVDYAETKVVDGDTYVKSDVHSTLLGGQDLELLLENKAAPNTKAGDLEYTKIVYSSPPPKNHVTVQRVYYSEVDYNKSKDAYTEVTYDGTAVDGTPQNGGALDFRTNKGKFRTLLHATVDSVPSHTYVCVAPGTTGCAPSHPEGLHSEPASYAIEVSSPIHVTMRDCTVSVLGVIEVPSTNFCDPSYPISSASLVRADLYVDSHFRVLKQIQQADCSPDCIWINLDTASTLVNGSIDSGSFDDDADWNSETYINLPRGFMTDNRQARISCSETGCEHSNTAGRVACPPGTDLISRHWFGDIHLAPELCESPAVDPATRGSAWQGQTNAVVDVYGTNFSPGWFAFVSTTSGVADTHITVTKVDWIDFWHMRLTLSVDASATVGSRDLVIGGPTGTDGLCHGCIQVTAG
ncbi:MAG: hypothetical protein WAT58_08825 [Candidatus Dormiibacterota bacterium]